MQTLPIPIPDDDDGAWRGGEAENVPWPRTGEFGLGNGGNGTITAPVTVLLWNGDAVEQSEAAA